MALTSAPCMASEIAEATDPRIRAWDVETSLRVSIIVVTWNSERWIESCLRSASAACAGIPHEILVRDNGSGDATARIVEQLAIPNVRLTASPSNEGFARATNSAAREGSGEYLMLLNPDCELTADSMALLLDALDRDTSAAAAVPLLIGDDGEPQLEFQLRRLPHFGSLAANLLLLERLFPRNRASAHYRYLDEDRARLHTVEQPAAAAFLLRRSTFLETGPFDESFTPAWFEDVDYCRRLAERGEKILLVRGARAKHHGGASLEHVPAREFLSIWYRNLFRYASKWLPPSQADAIRWMIVAGSLLRAGAAVAGFANHSMKRFDAARAYLSVAREAFARWPDGSPQS